MAKVKVLHSRTSPRNPNVLYNRVKILHHVIKNGMDYNHSAQRIYLTQLKRKIYPARRAVVYDLVEYNLKHKPNKLDPMDKAILNIPKNKFLQGLQPPKQSGKKKGQYSELESRARQVATTAEQMGLFNRKTGQFTPMGEKVSNGTFGQNDLIRQLLKKYVIISGQKDGVFPFHTFLAMMKVNSNKLSMNELTFLFGATTENKIKQAVKATQEFHKWYRELPSRRNHKRIRHGVIEIWNKYYPDNKLPDYFITKNSKDKKVFTSIHSDYADAFKNTLLRTGLFTTHGRGGYKTIHPILSTSKIQYTDLLNYNFDNIFSNLRQSAQGRSLAARKNVNWFGSLKPDLPWENKHSIKAIIQNKVASLQSKHYDATKLHQFSQEAKQSQSTSELDTVSDKLTSAISTVNIDYFNKVTCRNSNERQNILDALDDINKGREIDFVSPSLSLENIGWKALMSIGDNYQDHKVTYFGTTNADLSPKNYAAGHRPDMKVDYDNTILVGEVSRMTSIQQYEHEGSSVSRHVANYTHQNKDKNVIGLFLDINIGNPTYRMFYGMNWASWFNEPTQIVPFTIEQFKNLLSYIYKNKLSFTDFSKLLLSIAHQAYEDNLQRKFYTTWKKQIPKSIKQWKHEHQLVNN